MATKAEIQSLLAANESKRKDLAAKLGPMTDAAQQAYDTAAFFNPEGKKYSEFWTGTFNGQKFTDPNALYAAAKADFESKADMRKQTAQEFNALFPEKDALEQQLATAEDPTTTVKSPEATNPDQTDAASKEKMEKSEIVGDTSQPTSGSEAVVAEDGSLSKLRRNSETGELYDPGEEKKVEGVPAGAEPVKPRSVSVNVTPAQGSVKQDLRVIIKVPNGYLRESTVGPGNELAKNGGIVFPYTPNIGYEHKADYSSSTPMHSNYALYFYQRSSIGNISISGKFTVQNEQEAGIYLATLNLLRALTKMRSGGSTGDYDSGAPPPVCRLMAYGTMMLDNVPIAITSFRVELPDSVDYFTLGKGKPDPVYGVASVPTVSTIALGCIPMYSRNEMQKMSVTGWLNQRSFREAGML